MISFLSLFLVLNCISLQISFSLDFSQTKICPGNMLCTLDCVNCNLCSPASCSLSNNCYCPSKNIPGNIPLSQTPQFFFFTFDDSVHELTPWGLSSKIEFWRQNSSLKDKNNCPMRPTIYTMNIFTDFAYVAYLDKIGEVSLHSTTHTTSFQTSERKWRNELFTDYTDIAELAQVIPKGSRAPYLETNDHYFKVLKELGIKYDASSVYYATAYNPGDPSKQLNWWPFTLDFGYPEASIGYTSALDLTKRVPGMWEFPMIGYQYPDGTTTYEIMDYTISPTFVADFKRDFEKNYATNRAPLGFYFHSYYFINSDYTADDPQKLNVFAELLQWVMQHDNVLYATPQRVINWMKNPKPFSETILTPDFACASPNLTTASPCNAGVSKKTCTNTGLKWNTCYDQCYSGSYSYSICGDKCPNNRPDIDAIWKYEGGKKKAFPIDPRFFDPTTPESNQNYYRWTGKVTITDPINGTWNSNTGLFGLNGWFCSNIIITNENTQEGANGLILTVDSCSANSEFTSIYGHSYEFFNSTKFSGFRMIGKNIQIMRYVAITEASFCMSVNKNGQNSFKMNQLSAGVDLYNQTLRCDLSGQNSCVVKCGNKIIDSGETATNCPVDQSRTCPTSRRLLWERNLDEK